MPSGSYDRFGLTGNPFRDLSSENLSDVELYHVNLEVDDALRTIRDEVYDKENHAVVAIVGPHGSGKTERLLVARADAKERGAFAVYFDVLAKTPMVLRGLAEEFHKSATAAGLVKTFSAPGWLKGISALEKIKDTGYDPISAGKVIGLALNETAPSFLLLNDLHNLMESSEADAFAKTVQEITDVIKPGVFIMFVCYPSYLAWLTVNHAPFASRINRTFVLPGLTPEEAQLLLAKKLLPKRLVEDLDPIYPFDAEAVTVLNEAAGGNPRRLLELADLTIEHALSRRSFRVDVNVVQEVLAQRPARPGGAGVRETIASTAASVEGRPSTSSRPSAAVTVSSDSRSAKTYQET